MPNYPSVNFILSPQHWYISMASSKAFSRTRAVLAQKKVSALTTLSVQFLQNAMQFYFMAKQLNRTDQTLSKFMTSQQAGVANKCANI